ncbi:RNA polymerase sigma factor [Chitinophaga ginsengisoli]|uniref:RNA polymerase sigma-70 factor (ECF subfamily) n=1 Tax=Chitinophaga ginsengisoli TaxID=363837 RepID=A0A2P8FID6_9BACT|nr:sigma-70 family RNA polymerase sigma factor [Chitinophaga ginsengisoli]PSL21481.1 RNA polymerase sigma-70 factor (ECF subfamily) [Chitinophaga ginsengisoli]
MEKLSDNRLMELVREGNNHAFTALINRYWEQLYRHIYARLRHEEDTKDILQEIFISVWKNRDTIIIEEENGIKNYLFQAARYRVINHFGRPQAIIYNEEILSDFLSGQYTTSSHELLVVKEMEEKVHAALDQMPERLHLPYRLSRYQHLSNREIAARLSVSEQTVKNNISTTLRILRSYMHTQNEIPVVLLITILSFPS